MAARESLPKVFYCFLPLCVALNWSVGIATASVVLQTLSLARDSPQRVLFMPQLLRHCSPETLAGGLVVVLSVSGGLLGSLVALWSDRLGMKATVFSAVAVQSVGYLLVAFTPTYLIGMEVSSVGASAAFPVFMALFVRQFDDERQVQKMTTYFYSVSAFAVMLATLVAGLQPFWMGYLENVVLLLACWVQMLLMSGMVRESDPLEKAGARLAIRSPRCNDNRVVGFAVLCIFTVIFSAVFLQFLGGAFMVFTMESLAPLFGFKVPPPWFLSLNGLLDFLLSGPVAWIYERAHGVRFHVKLRVAFILVSCACAILAFAAKLAPAGGVSPLVPTVCMVLVSLGELHYMPVMLATIASELPEHMTGFYTGLHFMVVGAGNIVAGAGVPFYKMVGAEGFFMVLLSVAATGALGLQVIAPCLERCFSEAGRCELEALIVKGSPATVP
mmetsp:Transcript_159962/g.489326  ORF Transcript_159962/g.489326 Transcript_159962/m.489326 type:complete len:443 (-) Transcript_159962:8-1336(-)|eukprot:CAMPEP_0204600442 /NCGR_PEP_ID=MMETSP0661-20131031/55446_1 /ASSEMBLY_ACC=CAM_ASM_000606 /TAXON_ID=109239 /ORGANISM="Alexandrium margalefi, Strain AMGDE01CS-322" /LENGTH=442 /DNA_ID=CAMNT_0051611247 /DNA_START=38 /DNA_END=1366 /DNA_ORIENTATION=+